MKGRWGRWRWEGGRGEEVGMLEVGRVLLNNMFLHKRTSLRLFRFRFRLEMWGGGEGGG